VTSDESLKQEQEQKKAPQSAQTAKVVEFDLGDQRLMTAQASSKKDENFHILSLPAVGSLSEHLRRQEFEQEKSAKSKDYSNASSRL